MSINISEDIRSNYYQLEGTQGKVCDNLERINFFCDKLIWNIKQGQVNFLATLIIPVIYPVAKLCLGIDRAIYAIKGETISTEEYKMALNKWEKRLEAFGPKSEAIAYFVDGCIRHKIDADSCPFHLIAVKQPRFTPWDCKCFDMDGELANHKNKRQEIPQKKALLLHDFNALKSLKRSNSLERYKKLGDIFEDTYKRALKEEDDDYMNRELDDCGSLLFSNKLQMFDIKFANEVRSLFNKFPSRKKLF